MKANAPTTSSSSRRASTPPPKPTSEASTARVDAVAVTLILVADLMLLACLAACAMILQPSAPAISMIAGALSLASAGLAVAALTRMPDWARPLTASAVPVLLFAAIAAQASRPFAAGQALVLLGLVSHFLQAVATAVWAIRHPLPRGPRVLLATTAALATGVLAAAAAWPVG